MMVPFRYAGASGVVSGLRDTRAAFATNQLRDAAAFRGEVRHPVLLREALGALHSVVVSDYKYHPRDRLAFKAWLESQDKKFLAGLQAQSAAARAEMAALEARRDALDVARMQRLKPFYQARAAYFDWVYLHKFELFYLLDPVISVHPDELSFEAFSKDESSYARVAVRHDLFSQIDDLACGTTNVDFSARLAGELDRMRSYRSTQLSLDPGGFTVATEGDAAHREKKIDLPDSWVKGFLQVHATMTLGLTRFRMEAVDLFNLCRFLRRHKARVSPRAMRFELVPGRRVKVVMEPWEHVIELSATAVYEGPKALSIRTWGRDRLLTLARLLPVTRHVDVYLAGQGMPTLYVADLGPLTFTLALSGWTDNDWTGSTRFDLLSRRLTVDAATLAKTQQALAARRYGSDVGISQDAGVGLEAARSALSYLCQTGRAMYDLAGAVYRQRELFATPFTFAEAEATARTAGGAVPVDATERIAQKLFAGGRVMITARRPSQGGYKLAGSVGGVDGVRVRPTLHVDAQGRLVTAACSCKHFGKYGLTQGPCEHVLALRLAHMSRVEAE
jgi:hypothetical protein